MVPLIDVMLVLLVIFIITAPLLTQAVKLELPKASSQVNDLKPEKIDFAIDAAGRAVLERRVAVARRRRGALPATGRQAACSRRSTCAPTRASRIATSRRRWPTRRRRA